MKRWLAWLILCTLLLSGCEGNIAEDAAQTTQSVDTTPTDPGLYIPDSLAEQQSAGSVRAYTMAYTPCSGMGFMGEDIIVFSNETETTTTLTRLVGSNCSVDATVRLDVAVYAGEASVRVSQQWLSYYDHTDNAVVLLDSALREARRCVMPDDLRGTPAVSEDFSTAYYCTERSLYAVDIATGISRLVRNFGQESMLLEQVLFGNSVLQCFVANEQGVAYTEFISAQTGETLGKDTALGQIHGYDQTYFLQRLDGTTTENIFGTADGEQGCLVMGEGESLYEALAIGGVVSVGHDTQGVTLSLYDLASGHRSAAVRLDDISSVYALQADKARRCIWFVACDTQGQEAMLCWNPALSAVADETDYTTPRFSALSPDTVGLEQCRQQAAALGEQYGVSIVIGDVPQLPDDYSFLYEHQVLAFRKTLESLEICLAKFPEGFFEEVGKITDSGRVQICLVRGIEGDAPGTVTDVGGLQYWKGGEAYIALAIGDTLQQSFYHELSHVLDSYIFATTVDYDLWNDLNPAGFSYDENYTDYMIREDLTLAQGENRAFIDSYSMSYAKEDRARILEYALSDGAAEQFAPPILQAKLRRICVAIREAFGWEKDTRAFAWEQYLNQPLAYVGK